MPPARGEAPRRWPAVARRAEQQSASHGRGLVLCGRAMRTSDRKTIETIIYMIVSLVDQFDIAVCGRPNHSYSLMVANFLTAAPRHQSARPPPRLPGPRGPGIWARATANPRRCLLQGLKTFSIIYELRIERQYISTQWCSTVVQHRSRSHRASAYETLVQF